MKEPKQNFRPEGFTRVSVLLGMALAFVFISMLSLAPQTKRPAAEPLHEALQDALRLFVKTKIVQPVVPCGDPAEFFTTHLYLGDGFPSRTGDAASALSRCPLRVLGTGGRFHFCLRLQPELSAPLIFAEVSLQLVDHANGKVLNCAEYLEPRRSSAGARVDYTLFSIDDRGEDRELTKKRVTFPVNR